ncbi:MAG: hypothetical protein OSB00_03960 [Sphingomonas bacterium]|nr:hypothetical protein [Sphingomonas bacterium]
MKTLSALVCATALIAAPASAQTKCITTTEAKALTQVALPAILRQTGQLCAGRLPASSILRQSSGAFIAKYDAASDRAWPTARAAIVKLSDPAVTALLDSDYARPLLVTMIAPLITGRIAVEDCPTIDALVTDLAPLPAPNTASIVVTTLRYLQAEKAKGRNVAVPNLPLCPGSK